MNACEARASSGFSMKLLDAPRLRIDRERHLSGMDIAVAGRRMIGGNAEGDDFASGRRYAGLRAEFSERFSVPEDMVGGEHDDDRLPIARCFTLRRPPAATAAALLTPFGLEQDRRLCANILELLGDDAKAIVEIGDDYRPVRKSCGCRAG